MQLRPGDVYQFIPVWKENDQTICNKTVSVIFSLLNYLEKGQSFESDGIVIESLGDNLLHISTKVSPDDIQENLEMDFSTSQGLY